MSKNNTIEQLIEDAYRRTPWLGACSVEEAIEAAITYRRNLNTAERELFDEYIRSGRYPASAMETVEIVSGREKPQSAQAEPVREAVA